MKDEEKLERSQLCPSKRDSQGLVVDNSNEDLGNRSDVSCKKRRYLTLIDKHIIQLLNSRLSVCSVTAHEVHQLSESVEVFTSRMSPVDAIPYAVHKVFFDLADKVRFGSVESNKAFFEE